MIGIVAGRGAYPIALHDALRARGVGTAIACLAGQTDPGRFDEAVYARTFPIGALSAIARYFLSCGARVAYMAGGVERKGVLRFARPDLSALALVPHALFGRDDRLLRAVAGRFEASGVHVGDPRPVLGEAIPEVGHLAGPPLEESARLDLLVARDHARSVGARGGGQAVVAFRGRVSGTEDRRGTDALLASAPGPGAVIAKIAVPGQDERFDLPTVGPSTIRVAGAVRLAAIGIEAGRSLILSRPRVVELCGAYGISLVGLE